MTATVDRALDDLTLGGAVKLEDLVDREALQELVTSSYELFRVPIRLFSSSGALLADATERFALHTYLNQFPAGRAALDRTIAAVKAVRLEDDGSGRQPCVTGASYRVVSIQYDGESIGRMILGPYVAPDVQSPPDSLLQLDPRIEAARVGELLAKMPRADEQLIDRIGAQLRIVLDLVLFSGHKALLTTNVHLASVREGYRELQDKTAQLQRAYDRLKELDRLKSNFLATVSHELRTPLTSIIGYSEMLLEGIAGSLQDEQKDFLRTIHGKGEQLLELIKGLLDLSKLESGTMSLRKAEVHLDKVIQDVAQTLAPTAMKKSARIDVRLDEGLPAVWGDEERLRQVLLNLSDNAIKFTPEGGSIQLSAELTRMESPANKQDEGFVLFAGTRSAVELRVADTGVGIPEAERERVFDAFYQVDSSSTREKGGTGLGLSIVKRLVDAHGGTVRVEANEPQGAVFVVSIPCRRSSMLPQ